MVQLTYSKGTCFIMEYFFVGIFAR